MYTTRFLTPKEVKLINTLFSVHSKLVGEELTPNELDSMIRYYRSLIEVDLMKISMVFDENDSPVAMYTARLFPKIKGWWVAATKIKVPTNHFSTTSKIMAPGLDLMLETLEAEGYYKFWMGAPEQHHNIRNAVMVKQSNLLHRYDWVDELVIPKGQRCDIEIFEQNRRTCNWTDILIRMFVLKQEYRIEHMRKQGHINYTGALTSSKAPKPS